MAKAGYTCTTEGAVALSAATAKTVIGVQTPSSFGMDLIGYDVGFDGVTASAVPVLVELCTCTWGANAPGTNSTATTITQVYGRAIAVAAGFISGKTWTTEPTTLLAIESYLLTPNAGLVVVRYPLGQTPDNDVSKGFAIRLTAPAIVNVRATMWFERC